MRIHRWLWRQRSSLAEHPMPWYLWIEFARRGFPGHPHHHSCCVHILRNVRHLEYSRFCLVQVRWHTYIYSSCQILVPHRLFHRWHKAGLSQKTSRLKTHLSMKTHQSSPVCSNSNVRIYGVSLGRLGDFLFCPVVHVSVIWWLWGRRGDACRILRRIKLVLLRPPFSFLGFLRLIYGHLPDKTCPPRLFWAEMILFPRVQFYGGGKVCLSACSTVDTHLSDLGKIVFAFIYFIDDPSNSYLFYLFCISKKNCLANNRFINFLWTWIYCVSGLDSSLFSTYTTPPPL